MGLCGNTFPACFPSTRRFPLVGRVGGDLVFAGPRMSLVSAAAFWFAVVASAFLFAVPGAVLVRLASGRRGVLTDSVVALFP